MNPLAERVRAERLGRGWSVRDAASAAGLSNTWWARFEEGLQPITDGIVAGVALAFEWPADWPTQPDDGPLAALRAQMAELAARVDELQEQVELLGGVVVPAARRAAQPDARSTGDSS